MSVRTFVDVNTGEQTVVPWEAPDPIPATLNEYRVRIQASLDTRAQERGYDNGHTIATYATSSVLA